MGILRLDTSWLGAVFVAWGCSNKEAAKLLKKTDCPKPFLASLKQPSNTTGRCISDGGHALIWIELELTSAEAIGVLAHEAFHAAYAMLNHREVEFPGGEEAYAYLIEYIIEETLKATISDTSSGEESQ